MEKLGFLDLPVGNGESNIFVELDKLHNNDSCDCDECKTKHIYFPVSSF